MLIVLYLYSIIGVIMFRGQSEVITGIGAVKDPFVSVPESMFSMFRVITGEDWTDLRCDLLDNLTGFHDVVVSFFVVSFFFVSFFFVSFFVISAYLLVNIVVGAVVSTYDQVMEDTASFSDPDSVDPIVQLTQKVDLLT